MKERLRAKIEKAAKFNGVSMNAEMVRRLDVTFKENVSKGDLEQEHLFRAMAAMAATIEVGRGKRWIDDFPTAQLVARAWLEMMDMVLRDKPDLRLILTDEEMKRAPDHVRKELDRLNLIAQRIGPLYGPAVTKAEIGVTN